MFFGKNKKWIRVAVSILAVALSFVMPANEVLAAFAMSLSVNNTSGTSYTNSPFIANTNNELLITSGLMLPNGLDTRVYNSSSVAIPHMLADNNTLFVGDAPAHAASTFTFKGGESTLASTDIITGVGGYVLTPDDPSLEPGSNFDLSVSGYFDTTSGTGKNIVRKDGALLIWVSGSQEISANLTSSSANITLVAAGVATGVHTIRLLHDSDYLRLYVDGVQEDSFDMESGVLSLEASSGYVSLWSSDATYTTAHDAATGSVNSAVGNIGQGKSGITYYVYRAAHIFNTAGIPDNASVVSANFSLYVSSLTTTAETFYAQLVDATGVTVPVAAATYGDLHAKTTVIGQIHSSGLVVSDWNIWNLTNLSYISLTANTSIGLRSDKEIAASAPAVGSGQMGYNNNSGGANKPKLDIFYSTPMVDTANDWYWMENNVMPYADNISVTVNNVNQLLYRPDNIIHGTVLPDVSGHNNDGVITWGTSMLAVTSPALITLPATNIDTTSATLNGQLLDMAGMASYSTYFDYGITTSYGSSTTPVTLTVPSLMASDVTSLVPNTTYHFRAHAVSGNLSLTGGDLTFTTLVGEGGGMFQFGDGNARVFKSYLVTNDLLFTAEIVNTYTPYYPSQSPKEYFTVQLIDTDNTTILAATPQRQWGDKPIAIYLNPTQAAGITYGAGYYIRVQANFADNISVQYQLRHGLLPWNNDWKGSDLTRLDDWCISVATNMQAYYKGAGYVTVLTDRELAITDAIGGYFTTGIPAIGTVRPNLFTTSQQKPIFNLGTINNTWDNATAWSASVGPSIAADAAVFAIPFGMTGRDMLAAFVALGMLGVVMTGAASTGGFGALGFFLISVPILWLGTYFKIVGIQYVMVLTIIFGILFVRQFWVKTT